MSSEYKALFWRKDSNIVSISVTEDGSLICLTQFTGTMRSTQSTEIIKHPTYCTIYNDRNGITACFPFELDVRLIPPNVDLRQFFLTAERKLTMCYSVTDGQYIFNPSAFLLTNPVRCSMKLS